MAVNSFPQGVLLSGWQGGELTILSAAYDTWPQQGFCRVVRTGECMFYVKKAGVSPARILMVRDEHRGVYSPGTVALGETLRWCPPVVMGVGVKNTAATISRKRQPPRAGITFSVPLEGG